MQKTQNPMIHATQDYSMFKSIKGNRLIFPRHVQDLTVSIAKENMLPFNPIIVNEKMEILDGQHRLEVAKNNNLPVYYVVYQGGTIETVQRLNSTNRRWVPSDYLQSYVEQGREPYIKFKEFIQSQGLSIRQGLMLIVGDERGEAYTKAFRKGLLEFTEQDLKDAEYKAGFIEEIKAFFIDTGYSRAAFFRVINRMYIHKLLKRRFLEKLRNSNTTLRGHVRTKDYVRMMEDVINWHSRGDNIVTIPERDATL